MRSDDYGGVVAEPSIQQRRAAGSADWQLSTREPSLDVIDEL